MLGSAACATSMMCLGTSAGFPRHTTHQPALSPHLPIPQVNLGLPGQAAGEFGCEWDSHRGGASRGAHLTSCPLTQPQEGICTVLSWASLPPGTCSPLLWLWTASSTPRRQGGGHLAVGRQLAWQFSVGSPVLLCDSGESLPLSGALVSTWRKPRGWLQGLRKRQRGQEER